MDLYSGGTKIKPCVDPSPDTLHPIEVIPSKTTFRAIRRIMVVDDDIAFVDRVRKILSPRGIAVSTAENCLDALYRASQKTPDVVLISLTMPTIDGTRFCSILSLQPQLSGCYRVVCAPAGDPENIDLKAFGAHACVVKTPEAQLPDNLLAAMSRIEAMAARSDLEPKRAEERSRNILAEKLHHAQKMEAVGTLAGGIAHDFNNILQTMLGYAQLSLFEPKVPHKVRENLEEIQVAAKKATSLIRRLLVFSRKVDRQLGPIDLNEQIRHIAAVLKRTIPKMVRIDLELDPALFPIHADGNLLELILINLGINARDAMPDGGTLLFATRNVELSEHYRAAHPDAKPGPFVELTVRDTGTGMPDAVRKQIFDPFFTTKAHDRGTGLGLAMVYGIVKDHEGFIDCTSSVGQGTTFTIYIPARASAPSATQTPPRPASQAAGGRETILLIDDEAGIRHYAQEILKRYGYTVLVAKSGEEGIDIYRRLQQKINLTIVDLFMPGMGGLKCVEALLKLNRDCRILISSGYAMHNDVKSTLDAGASDFIAKPYLTNELLAKIRRCLDAE